MTQSSRRSNLFLLTLFAFLVGPATFWSAVPLVLKNPPIRPSDADSPVLIWDIDLKLANADGSPRNQGVFVADSNGVLSATRQTAVWYLNNNVYIGGA